jgi:hypothetical protein
MLDLPAYTDAGRRYARAGIVAATDIKTTTVRKGTVNTPN